MKLSAADRYTTGFEVDQDEQEPVFRCQEGAVFVDGKPAHGPRFPIHPPGRHPGVERGLEGRDELVKSRNSIGRDWRSVNRKPAMGRASGHSMVISEAHHTRKKAG